MGSWLLLFGVFNLLGSTDQMVYGATVNTSITETTSMEVEISVNSTSKYRHHHGEHPSGRGSVRKSNEFSETFASTMSNDIHIIDKTDENVHLEDDLVNDIVSSKIADDQTSRLPDPDQRGLSFLMDNDNFTLPSFDLDNGLSETAILHDEKSDHSTSAQREHVQSLVDPVDDINSDCHYRKDASKISCLSENTINRPPQQLPTIRDMSSIKELWVFSLCVTLNGPVFQTLHWCWALRY